MIIETIMIRVTNHKSRVAVSHLRFAFQCTSRGGSTSDHDTDICIYIRERERERDRERWIERDG